MNNVLPCWVVQRKSKTGKNRQWKIIRARLLAGRRGFGATTRNYGIWSHATSDTESARQRS